MPNSKPLVVEWTGPALKDILVIRNYLKKNFGEPEIVRFYKLLTSFEEAVSSFPKLYLEFSSKKKLRRAVLNKNLSIYYTVRKQQIFVVSVLDNRMDYSRLL